MRLLLPLLWLCLYLSVDECASIVPSLTPNLLLGDDSVVASLVDPATSRGYYVMSRFPTRIVCMDLTTQAVLSTVTLPSTLLEGPVAAVLDASSGFIYLSMGPATHYNRSFGIVARVSVSLDSASLSTLLVPNCSLGIYSMVVDYASGYLIATCSGALRLEIISLRDFSLLIPVNASVLSVFDCTTLFNLMVDGRGTLLFVCASYSQGFRVLGLDMFRLELAINLYYGLDGSGGYLYNSALSKLDPTTGIVYAVVLGTISSQQYYYPWAYTRVGGVVQLGAFHNNPWIPLGYYSGEVNNRGSPASAIAYDRLSDYVAIALNTLPPIVLVYPGASGFNDTMGICDYCPGFLRHSTLLPTWGTYGGTFSYAMSSSPASTATFSVDTSLGGTPTANSALVFSVKGLQPAADVIGAALYDPAGEAAYVLSQSSPGYMRTLSLVAADGTMKDEDFAYDMSYYQEAGLEYIVPFPNEADGALVLAWAGSSACALVIRLRCCGAYEALYRAESACLLSEVDGYAEGKVRLPNHAVIDDTGTYAYVGASPYRFPVTDALLLKVRISDLTVVDRWSSLALALTWQWMDYDALHGIVYACVVTLGGGQDTLAFSVASNTTGGMQRLPFTSISMPPEYLTSDIKYSSALQSVFALGARIVGDYTDFCVIIGDALMKTLPSSARSVGCLSQVIQLQRVIGSSYALMQVDETRQRVIIMMASFTVPIIFLYSLSPLALVQMVSLSNYLPGFDMGSNDLTANIQTTEYSVRTGYLYVSCLSGAVIAFDTKTFSPTTVAYVTRSSGILLRNTSAGDRLLALTQSKSEGSFTELSVGASGSLSEPGGLRMRMSMQGTSNFSASVVGVGDAYFATCTSPTVVFRMPFGAAPGDEFSDRLVLNDTADCAQVMVLVAGADILQPPFLLISTSYGPPALVQVQVAPFFSQTASLRVPLEFGIITTGVQVPDSGGLVIFATSSSPTTLLVVDATSLTIINVSTIKGMQHSTCSVWDAGSARARALFFGVPMAPPGGGPPSNSNSRGTVVAVHLENSATTATASCVIQQNLRIADLEIVPQTATIDPTTEQVFVAGGLTLQQPFPYLEDAASMPTETYLLQLSLPSLNTVASYVPPLGPEGGASSASSLFLDGSGHLWIGLTSVESSPVATMCPSALASQWYGDTRPSCYFPTSSVLTSMQSAPPQLSITAVASVAGASLLGNETGEAVLAQSTNASRVPTAICNDAIASTVLFAPGIDAPSSVLGCIWSSSPFFLMTGNLALSAFTETLQLSAVITVESSLVTLWPEVLAASMWQPVSDAAGDYPAVNSNFSSGAAVYYTSTAVNHTQIVDHTWLQLPAPISEALAGVLQIYSSCSLSAVLVTIALAVNDLPLPPVSVVVIGGVMQSPSILQVSPNIIGKHNQVVSLYLATLLPFTAGSDSVYFSAPFLPSPILCDTALQMQAGVLYYSNNISCNAPLLTQALIGAPLDVLVIFASGEILTASSSILYAAPSLKDVSPSKGVYPGDQLTCVSPAFNVNAGLPSGESNMEIRVRVWVETTLIPPSSVSQRAPDTFTFPAPDGVGTAGVTIEVSINGTMAAFNVSSPIILLGQLQPWVSAYDGFAWADFSDSTRLGNVSYAIDACTFPSGELFYPPSLDAPASSLVITLEGAWGQGRPPPSPRMVSITLVQELGDGSGINVNVSTSSPSPFSSLVANYSVFNWTLDNKDIINLGANILPAPLITMPLAVLVTLQVPEWSPDTATVMLCHQDGVEATLGQVLQFVSVPQILHVFPALNINPAGGTILSIYTSTPMFYPSLGHVVSSISIYDSLCAPLTFLSSSVVTCPAPPLNWPPEVQPEVVLHGIAGSTSASGMIVSYAPVLTVSWSMDAATLASTPMPLTFPGIPSIMWNTSGVPEEISIIKSDDRNSCELIASLPASLTERPCTPTVFYPDFEDSTYSFDFSFQKVSVFPSTAIACLPIPQRAVILHVSVCCSPDSSPTTKVCTPTPLSVPVAGVSLSWSGNASTALPPLMTPNFRYSIPGMQWSFTDTDGAPVSAENSTADAWLACSLLLAETDGSEQEMSNANCSRVLANSSPEIGAAVQAITPEYSFFQYQGVAEGQRVLFYSVCNWTSELGTMQLHSNASQMPPLQTNASTIHLEWQVPPSAVIDSQLVLNAPIPILRVATNDASLLPSLSCSIVATPIDPVVRASNDYAALNQMYVSLSNGTSDGRGFTFAPQAGVPGSPPPHLPYLGYPAFDSLLIAAKGGITFQLNSSCIADGLTVQGPSAITVIRGCEQGQAPSGNNGWSCSPCPQNTYADGGTDPCHPCPPLGASCGNGILTLQQGYFVNAASATAAAAGALSSRFNASLGLLQCPNQNACVVNATARTFTCATGYQGPLCGLCATGYTLDATVCNKCISTVYAALLMTLIICVAIGVVVWLAVFRVAGAKSKGAIALRQLLALLQAFGVMSTFKAQSMQLLHQVLGWTATAGGGNLASVSVLDCILQLPFITRLLLCFLLPLILTAFVSIVACLHNSPLIRSLRTPASQQRGASLRHLTPPPQGTEEEEATPSGSRCSTHALMRSVSSLLSLRSLPPPSKADGGQAREVEGSEAADLRRKVRLASRRKALPVIVVTVRRPGLSSILWFTSALLLPLISAALKAISCTTPIGGKRYLVADLSIECGSATQTGAAALGILVIALLGVGYPLLIILFLGYRVSHQKGSGVDPLQDPFFTAVWRLVYDGYDVKRGLLWWEALVILRKVALASALEFLGTSSQGMAVVGIIMSLSLFLHELYLPYEDAAFNASERVCLFVAAFTPWLALTYSSNVTLSDKDPGDTAITTVIVLLFAASLLYMLSVLFANFLAPVAASASRFCSSLLRRPGFSVLANIVSSRSLLTHVDKHIQQRRQTTKALPGGKEPPPLFVYDDSGAFLGDKEDATGEGGKGIRSSLQEQRDILIAVASPISRRGSESSGTSSMNNGMGASAAAAAAVTPSLFRRPSLLHQSSGARKSVALLPSAGVPQSSALEPTAPFSRHPSGSPVSFRIATYTMNPLGSASDASAAIASTQPVKREEALPTTAAHTHGQRAGRRSIFASNRRISAPSLSPASLPASPVAGSGAGSTTGVSITTNPIRLERKSVAVANATMRSARARLAALKQKKTTTTD